ncbi:hypothetical protein CBM2597_U10234 [Cupriavidus taiwanensis]|uniref:Uncharacterized protein n=1 Tax=Cupriavidus taiwanensis TaxID=164546 RepID=A0A7Z7JHZ3_9BURK|nr:hypothetical protein CBM2597_U10234 [Cupriavidus taiwanensis]SPC25739.1 hypothetical protein CBM2594_U10240 [Cupriavidus taiwanensis]
MSKIIKSARQVKHVALSASPMLESRLSLGRDRLVVGLITISSPGLPPGLSGSPDPATIFTFSKAKDATSTRSAYRLFVDELKIGTGAFWLPVYPCARCGPCHRRWRLICLRLT